MLAKEADVSAETVKRFEFRGSGPQSSSARALEHRLSGWPPFSQACEAQHSCPMKREDCIADYATVAEDGQT
jgi:hypothetical protein